MNKWDELKEWLKEMSSSEQSLLHVAYRYTLVKMTELESKEYSKSLEEAGY